MGGLLLVSRNGLFLESGEAREGGARGATGDAASRQRSRGCRSAARRRAAPQVRVAGGGVTHVRRHAILASPPTSSSTAARPRGRAPLAARPPNPIRSRPFDLRLTATIDRR